MSPAKKKKASARRSAKTKTKTCIYKPDKIPKEWKKLLRMIPDYDPIETAGHCVFDVDAAQAALDFFPDWLKHVKGKTWAGKPFELENWQGAIVANIFGWKRPDGTRRYREVFLYVPRKNGKTCLAAGILVCIMFTDGEPGAEIYSAAADREQAGLVFEQVEGMIKQEKELRGRSTIYTKSITLNDGSGTYKKISADANTKHGYNVHLAIVDELHAQPNRDLVDALITATASRTQPLIMHVTTADFDRPSICNEKHDYATKVRDSVIDDEAFLPIVYEVEIDEDWHDQKVWAKANPNMGVSFTKDYMVRAHKKAIEVPTEENTFKRLKLNLRTEQAVRWIPLDKWDKCAMLDESDFGLVKWYGGLDLSSTTDITAFVLYSPENDCVVPYFWVPEDSAHMRERRDRVPYVTWSRQGLIKLTEGNVVDYNVVREDIKKAGKKFNIVDIAVDRWQAQQLMTDLTDDGFEVTPFGQGFQSMSLPTKELEKLIIGGDLRHGGNDVLRWMASNVCVETDAAENLKPSKKKSTQRIDGIVALIMAIGRAISPDESGTSVYEKRGVKVL